MDIVSYINYIIMITVLVQCGTHFCEIRTNLLLSLKDKSSGDVMTDCQRPSATSCVNECMKYETHCQAASYNPDQERCLLHSKHPLNATAQVSSSNGYRLYYSKFGECDNGWLKFGDRCYFFNSNPLTWDQAMAACSLLRSNLLKIENSAENDFVRTKCIEYGGHFYWIGARYSTQYGQYMWYDGTTLDYTSWNPGEPDTIGCVDLLHLYNYNWNDHPDCNTYGESICERGLFD